MGAKCSLPPNSQGVGLTHAMCYVGWRGPLEDTTPQYSMGAIQVQALESQGSHAGLATHGLCDLG